MTVEEKQELSARSVGLAAQAGVLPVAALMADVYREQGDALATEGAIQTVRSALALLEEHLAYFRNLAK